MSAPNPPLPPPQGQPYGQQPPIAPPQGYPQQPMMPPPPQGQPVGQVPPPGQGQWPQAAVQPKRKRGFPRWLISLIAIVVVGVGVYAFNYFTSDVAQAKAGDCAHVSGTESKPDYKKVDCGSAEVTHTVGKALSSTSSTCGGDYDEFTLTGRNAPSTKLCLVPKLSEGACYDMASTDMSYPKTDCGKGGSKVVKVTKVDSAKADEKLCGDDGLAMTFPEPPTTICLGAAK